MITNPRSSSMYLFVPLIVALLLPFPFLSADPDSLQDFCVADLKASSTIHINGFPCKPVSEVTSNDFFFDGLSKEANTSNNNGATVTPGNVLTFPGLNTLGLSMNRVDYALGGVNPPHTHPRASESGVVIEGKLFVGFISTSNVLYYKVLSAGEMFIIPKGLVHFQWNVGKGKALAFTAFNSHLPGAASLPTTLFASSPSIPDEILTKALQAEPDVIESIKAKFHQ